MLKPMKESLLPGEREEQKKEPPLRPKSENTKRDERCRESLTKSLPGGEQTPPDPQGACAQETTSQGSE
jgi:hypothetical protein